MHKEYAQTADQVLSDLQSGPEGLSAAQAESRLAEYGPNRLREAPQGHPAPAVSAAAAGPHAADPDGRRRCIRRHQLPVP